MKTLLIFLLGLAGTVCTGQPIAIVPGCCEQAIRLSEQVKLVTAQRDTIKAVGDRLIKAKDSRIAELGRIGTERLGDLNRKLEARTGTVEMLRSELMDEIIRSRFAGFGRKRWAKRLLEKIPTK